jgi:hypothetical protein
MHHPKYNILVFFYYLVLTNTVVALGQPVTELYELYTNKEMVQLYEKAYQLSQKYPDNLEIRFFKTLFIENAEEAIKIYEELYHKSQGRFKKVIASKISDYYYAKGFYVKAADYQVVAVEQMNQSHKPVKQASAISKKADSDLVIQVGAFKFKENAQYLQNVLRSNRVPSRVVAREIGQNTLYCVWIDGKSNFEETREIAENINKKFNLKYRIFKP